MTVGKGIRPRQESRDRWPAEIEKALIDLVALGGATSYGHLAELLNEKFPKAQLSRNAVLGKVSRLKLSHGFKRKPAKSKQVKGAGRETKQARHLQIVRVRLKDRFIGQPEVEPMSDDARSSAFSAAAWGKPTKSISKITDRDCKWPFDCDDGKAVRYCGDAVHTDGAVYCLYHTRLSLPPAGQARVNLATYRPRYR